MIGADDEEVRARALVFVGDAGRDYDNVAGAQLHRPAALATESHADPTGGDAEHLVRATVIVMMRIDPIPPSAGPPVAVEQRHATRCGIAVGFERAAVDDQRQPRVVRHIARALAVASGALKATPGVDDVATITERPVPGLQEAARLDDIAGLAHPMGGERLGQPVASDLLRLAVVVRRHHRIGPSIVSEGRRCVGDEILDADRVVVDDAADEHGEAGEDERAHLVGLPDQLRASLPSFSIQKKHSAI
jgi:hypothetical protein